MNLLFGIIPSPTPMQSRSRVYDLKTRLDWGKPALTIIDIRDRQEFNCCRITGAVNLPTNELVDSALVNFELSRDLYIYSDADEDTLSAAAKLRQAGFYNVSELQGGLPAWKAMGYQIESGTLMGCQFQ
ncbi:MAG: rhodanese-like domain-containing protein [Leptolyngbyaceae cyanobacterium CRU_2_3]|nr:rhodanese-like domain-containing protein [Leptolyngbyaceae cyanobacterium CRU_2_3]